MGFVGTGGSFDPPTHHATRTYMYLYMDFSTTVLYFKEDLLKLHVFPVRLELLYPCVELYTYYFHNMVFLCHMHSHLYVFVEPRTALGVHHDR